MTTAAAGKRKALRRRRPKANIAGGPKTQANAGIASMLRDGSSWTAVQDAFGCSRATIAKIAK